MRILKAILGALVIAGAGVAGLQLSDRLLAAPDAQGATAARPDGPVPVDTIPVETAAFADSVRAVGTARARHAVTLMPDASGRITRIAVQPGSQLEAGDLVLELDARAQEADLKAAEATLTEAEAAFQRQEQLNRSGSASDAAFQTARATLLRAEADRDRARLTLEDRRIHAPFAGVVGLIDLIEGQLLDTSTPVTTLDDLSAIEVDFAVPETLLPRLVLNQQVQLRSAAWPDRVFQGRITGIDTRVDATTRSIALQAEVSNADRALAGGMFLQVELVLDRREAPAVPESALNVEGNRHQVLIVRDGVADMVDVAIGQQSGDLVEVRSGLTPGAQIIVTNLHRVQPGTAVEATPRAATREATAQAATGADG